MEELTVSREELVNLIIERGGTSVGLDLSGKRFAVDDDYSNLNLKGIILADTKLSECNLRGVELTGANLKNAILERIHLEEASLFGADLEGADLIGAHLEDTNLSFAHLEGAILAYAHLKRADLSETYLKGADLTEANLEGANFQARLSDDTRLGMVNWGSFILQNESNGIGKWAFLWASEDYRLLKRWYTSNGYYDVAGKFFFREMTAKRKAMKWWPNPLNRAFSKLISILCGYGEKPERTVLSAFVIILGLAISYFAIGTLTPNAFLDCLYYSFVSFTAVGYGAWVTSSAGWVKWLGVIETILGVFMMALFLVTFTRKMTR